MFCKNKTYINFNAPSSESWSLVSCQKKFCNVMFSIDMSAIFLTLCFKVHTREFLKSNTNEMLRRFGFKKKWNTMDIYQSAKFICNRMLDHTTYYFFLVFLENNLSPDYWNCWSLKWNFERKKKIKVLH